jgi:hypothetical protein
MLYSYSWTATVSPVDGVSICTEMAGEAESWWTRATGYMDITNTRTDGGPGENDERQNTEGVVNLVSFWSSFSFCFVLRGDGLTAWVVMLSWKPQHASGVCNKPILFAFYKTREYPFSKKKVLQSMVKVVYDHLSYELEMYMTCIPNDHWSIVGILGPLWCSSSNSFGSYFWWSFTKHLHVWSAFASLNVRSGAVFVGQ